MDIQIKEYLIYAKISELKNVLVQMEMPTNGTKAVLKVRVEDAFAGLENEAVMDIIRGCEENNGCEEQCDNRPHEFPVAENNGTQEEQCNNVQLDNELSELRQLLQKKKEIRDLRRQLAELEIENCPSKPSFVNFKDVEESMQIFSGDDKVQIKNWFKQFEEMADVLKWDKKLNFLYAKRLLTGTAKLFLRTVHVQSYLELKTALIKEFSKTVTCADIHNEIKKPEKDKKRKFAAIRIGYGGNCTVS